MPAGGSVAALSGAGSAALLALVCSVLQRHGIDGVAALLPKAESLQGQLLRLVDEDAAAFRAYLDAKHDRALLAPVVDSPLEIARACLEVVELGNQVDSLATGSIRGDVHAARHIASAAALAALDLAEENVGLAADAAAKRQLRERIARLRQH